MKIKRFFALFLAILLILLVGCNNHPDNETTDNPLSDDNAFETAYDTVRILFSSKDSLDPYTCVTEQNSALAQFIFDPLLILNNQYDIEYRLAKSVTVTEKLCVIELRNAKFSDGSQVTAEDVVFSFNKAKKSTTTRHAAALKYAVAAVAVNNTKVEITLSRNDIYFANLLTFPIMKSGSDQLKDTDNQALPPIGAGRYVFNKDNASLSRNKYYYGQQSAIKNIVTVDCPDNEAVNQAIVAGMIDLYFSDLSNNIIPKMNGNSSDISQTRLVFIGINPNNPQLSNSLFRQAISSAIDRQTICSSAYYSKATPALGPVPTIWKPVESLLSIEQKPNVETAKKNIELAGFTTINKNGFYTLKNGNPITFSLLVNNNNESRLAAANKIADNLSLAGIKINVKAVSETQYRAMIRSGSYDLYLGEIRFEENMDIKGIVSLKSGSVLSTEDENTTTSDSKFSTSSKKTSSVSSSHTANSSDDSLELQKPGEITLTSVDAYNGYYAGQYTLQDLITAFTAELPVIPVCFKNGLVIYSDRFGNGLTPSRTELFHGIEYLK